MTQKLATAQAATGAGTPVGPKLHKEYGVAQVEITGVATVNIEGRVDGAAPWVVITTLTSSDAVSVALMTQIRSNVTSFTSGVVNAWLED